MKEEEEEEGKVVGGEKEKLGGLPVGRRPAAEEKSTFQDHGTSSSNTHNERLEHRKSSDNKKGSESPPGSLSSQTIRVLIFVFLLHLLLPPVQRSECCMAPVPLPNLTAGDKKLLQLSLQKRSNQAVT